MATREPRKGPILVLMRHARALSGDGGTDKDRALSEVGREQAAEVGRDLRSVGFVPDVALVSSATRTRQTWEILAATANYTVEPVLSGEIYRAYVEELLEELRAVDPAAQRVLLVGHEPAISATAYKLAGTGSNPEAVARVRRGVPTAAHAIIQPGGPWESLGYEPSMLAAVITPLI